MNKLFPICWEEGLLGIHPIRGIKGKLYEVSFFEMPCLIEECHLSFREDTENFRLNPGSFCPFHESEKN